MSGQAWLPKKKKKSETDLTITVLKNDSKHTRDLQDAFQLDETGQNVQIFKKVLFSKLLQQKNKKLIKLSCVSWMWEAYRALFLLPASHTQLIHNKLN